MSDVLINGLTQKIHAGLRGIVNDEYRWQAAKASAMVAMKDILLLRREIDLYRNKIEDVENEYFILQQRLLEHETKD